jgi:hypothetical protein
MRSRRIVVLLGAGLLAVRCGGGEVPFDVGGFRSGDFPSGDAFLFGVVLDERSGAGVEGLPVTVTPSDGLPLTAELESPIQAETVTNRRGEFTFSRIAPGDYVLFARFDANHKGYGEVVQRAQASVRPIEVRVFPPPVDLRFSRPRDGGTIAPADTALLVFTRLRLADLLTVTSETRPLYARVAIRSGSGGPPAGSDIVLAGGRAPVSARGDAPAVGGKASAGNAAALAGGPIVFEIGLGEEALERGEVKVPVEAGGLADPVRLESSLGFHVVYRDPRGGLPLDREIRGQAISVATP